jgi:molecular chaperone GrpE
MTTPEPSLNPNGADAPADSPATETPTQPAPEARLAELEAKHAEMADAYLRAKAETENIRRRADEEVSKARQNAL